MCDAYHDQYTVTPVLSGHSKSRPKVGFQDWLSLNAGQKYCRMLQYFSTFIKLPSVIDIFHGFVYYWVAA